MDNQQHLLDKAEFYLQNFVAPHAAEMDNNPEVLRNAIKGLGELNLLALRVPKEWGGAEVSDEIFQNFQELVARYSGALAFLQTQHQSAAGMLVQSDNSSLKQEYLPYLGKGQVLVGVGFSHLRREGEQPILAVAVDGGYQLDGQVPWVTGFGLFQEFIVAAALPDGRAIFGIVPFVETYQEVGGAIRFSKPMELAAIASTNTVTAQLSNWLLPSDRVVSIKPAGWIHENDKNNVLRATSLALGCARAGLDILSAASYKKSQPFLTSAFKLLNEEVINCRIAIRKSQQQCRASLPEQLQLRAWAIDLAVRCAHAAVTVSSGAANYSHHPAQRVYREALVFTVSGQTGALMEATLARLVRSSFPE